MRVEGELHIQFSTVDDRLIDILPNCGIAVGRHGLLEVLCGKAGDNVDDCLLVHAEFFGPLGGAHRPVEAGGVSEGCLDPR